MDIKKEQEISLKSYLCIRHLITEFLYSFTLSCNTTYSPPLSLLYTNISHFIEIMQNLYVKKIVYHNKICPLTISSFKNFAFKRIEYCIIYIYCNNIRCL